MNFEEYQNYWDKENLLLGEGDELSYCAIALSGETGEVAEKIKKQLRGDPNPPSNEDVAKELGDVLSYLTIFARKLGYTLQEVAEMSIVKNDRRRADNTIRGSGDNR